MLIAAYCTVTVTWRETTPPQPLAVRVYMVVVVGLITMDPGVPMPPMPWSMSARSASVTAPQLSVTASPGATALGLASKDAMTGGPGQAAGTGVDGGTRTTSTVTSRLTVPPQLVAVST